MQMLSIANLPHRAKIERTKGPSLSQAPQMETLYTDEPCLLIAETTIGTNTGFGRIPTGRYNCLFRAETKMGIDYQITIVRNNRTRTFKVDSFIDLDTHVETTLTEKLK